MVREMSQQGRLADPGFAADLDRKACFERGERRSQFDPPIEQPSNQSRSEQDRRRARTDVSSFGPRRVADHGTAELANLQDMAANRYLAADRTVERGFADRWLGV